MIVPNTKKRLIELLKVLYELSYAQHFFTTPGLIVHMNEQGLSMDRKTLTEDIKFLNEMVFDIVTVKSSPNKYYWQDRRFKETELCLLIDAVSSSRFIGARKADVLRQKFISMSSMYQQKKLHRHIRHTGKGIADAKDLYNMIDSIKSAINDNKTIRFKYFEYNGNKEKKYRGTAEDGDIYGLSPYCLYWNEDFYYVVG